MFGRRPSNAGSQEATEMRMRGNPLAVLLSTCALALAAVFDFGFATAAPVPLNVRVTAPVAGALVSGRVEIRAEIGVLPPQEVLFVEFVVDGRLLFADSTAPFEFIWQAPEPAAHRIIARAFGSSGAVVEHSIDTRGPAETDADVLFRSRVERVEVFARVDARHRGSVPLTTENFAVFEGGVSQPVVAAVRTTDLPLTVGFMLDCSGSMVDRLGVVLETAGSFIEGLVTNSQDMAFVMSFADVSSVLQEFTNDIGRLSDSLQLINTGRYTRLFDSLVLGAAQFRGHDGQRALVILTDGHDANSDAGLGDAIEAAQRADVAIYPVAVGVTTRFFYERWVLERLARETGGKVSYLEPRDDPARIYEAISDDLRQRYRITYEPTAPGGSGEWRPLEVRLAVAGARRPRLLRARPGYFAR